MPIRVTCNGCGTQYALADTAAGKRVKCKHCGTTFQIPGAGTKPAETAAAQRLHPEDEFAKDAPGVKFRDDSESVFAGDHPAATATGAIAPTADLPPIREPSKIDDLDVAAAERARIKEEAANTNVGRPEAEAFSTGQKRKLKLKPGAVSFSEDARRLATAKAQEKERLELRRDLRVIRSDWVASPLAIGLRYAGFGLYLIAFAVWAIRGEEILILRNFFFRSLLFLGLFLPTGFIFNGLIGKLFKYKPTEPLLTILVTMHASIFLLAGIATLCMDPKSIRDVLALGTVPVSFIVFHLCFQQGFLRNMAAYTAAIVIPAALFFGIIYALWQSDGALVGVTAEYVAEIPASKADVIYMKIWKKTP